MSPESKEWTISVMPPDHVRHYWDDIYDAVRSTNFYEFWTPQQLHAALLEGSMQCWSFSDSAIRMILITDIISYQSGLREFRFIGAVGSSLEEFLPLAHDCFYKAMKVTNCHRAAVIGRKGWERLLKPFGFRHSYSVFVKDIDPPKEN